MGDLTKRADRFVGKMLRQWRVLERRHPVETALVQEAIEAPSVHSRLQTRRQSLRQHSVKGK